MDAEKSATRLLRPKQAAYVLGVSRITLWRMVRDGRLPKPVQISTQAVGWPESEINRFVAERVADRDAMHEASPSNCMA